jgi:hypothetical protein
VVMVIRRCCSFFAQRQFIQGVVISGVKGERRGEGRLRASCESCEERQCSD